MAWVFNSNPASVAVGVFRLTRKVPGVPFSVATVNPVGMPSLSRPGNESLADLIATPETALPILASQLPEGYLAQLATFGKDSGSTILVGVPMHTSPGVYLNSVIGMSTAQPNAYRYDKHHLVPFGEFIPPGARWFVELMQIPLGDFGRGDLLQPPLQIKDQWLLPNICYEDLFGEEIAAQLFVGGGMGEFSCVFFKHLRRNSLLGASK